MDKAALHIGAVVFIHRFGSSLNAHVHFHVCVVDGVFEALADGGVNFHAASGLEEAAVTQVQAAARTRILRAFVGRGLIESFDAKEMLAYQHSGFSVDASVCIEATDRAGLDRLSQRAIAGQRLRGGGKHARRVWRATEERCRKVRRHREKIRGESGLTRSRRGPSDAHAARAVEDREQREVEADGVQREQDTDFTGCHFNSHM